MSLFDNLNLGSDLDLFKKNTDNLVNDTKRSVLTPMDTLSNNMKDGISLVKSTDTKLQSVISSYKSTAIEQLNGIVGALSGGLLNADSIIGNIRVGPDGVFFSKDDLMRSVSDSIGFDVSGKDAFTRQLADNVNSEFGRITGSYGTLFNADGGEFHVNKNWRDELGRSTMDTVLRYTDMKDIVDVSVTNSFYNSLMFSAADYGMYDSYEDIMAKYPRPEDAQDGLVEAVGRMIFNGDLNSLDAVIGLLNQGNKNAILSRYPNFLSDLLSSFTFGPDVTPGQYDMLRVKFQRITDELVGPDWELRKTQFGVALNLGLVNYISGDMLILLQEVDRYVPLCCAAGMFHDEKAMDNFYTWFPETPRLGSLR